MPNVRVLVWNIKFFARSTIDNAGRITKIINLVQAAGVAANYDIFIIIEPDKAPKATPIAGVPNSGHSVQALQIVYYALHHRNANWRAVPPRRLCGGSKPEMIGVFYESANVTFTGPEQIPVPTPAVLAAAGPGLGHIGAGVVGSAWGAAVGNSNVGRVRHSRNANPIGLGNAELLFPASADRRPYGLSFTAGGAAFQIYAIHAPEPQSYNHNVRAIQRIAQIYHVGGNPAHTPTIVCGDFNCCTLGPPCPVAAAHQWDVPRAQDRLASNQAAAYAYWADAIRVMEATTAVVVGTHAVRTAVGVAKVAPTNALAAHVTAAVNAATRIGNIVGGGLPALILAATGTVANLGAATALNADGFALAARAALIAITTHLGGNYNPPPYLQHFDLALQHTVTAHNQWLLGNPANSAAAANLLGADVTNARGVSSNQLRATEHAAAGVTGLAATGANALTPNIDTVATNALRSLKNLGILQYKTHVVRDRSSLNTPGNAFAGNYRLHAYDHIMSTGFLAEANGGIEDVIFNDAGYVAAAGGTTNQFRAFYKRIYKGPGAGAGNGISDHLPARITVTI
jgi:hypothetical protein